MSNDLLNKSRIALRITNTAYDTDINRLIDAAKLDIKESGIEEDSLLDLSLYDNAIVTFVCANFGLDNPDSEMLQNRYEKQLAKMALLQDHTGSGGV